MVMGWVLLYHKLILNRSTKNTPSMISSDYFEKISGIEPSKELIGKIKATLEKEKGSECSWEEASKVASDLKRLAELIAGVSIEESQRQLKLKEFPKIFKLDGIGYTCSICGGSASQENSWYDKYGIKCMDCQRGIDKKQIPASLSKRKDSWYSKYELESNFNIKGPDLRKWIKQDILKARTITEDNNKVHFQIFLIKENKEMLLLKRLVRMRMTKETLNGQEWLSWHPCYNFVDPYEHLKGYKIMDYLKVIYP